MASAKNRILLQLTAVRGDLEDVAHPLLPKKIIDFQQRSPLCSSKGPDIKTASLPVIAFYPCIQPLVKMRIRT